MSEFKPIEEVMTAIVETQGEEWDGLCDRKECYWNMFHPIRNPEDRQCVSESLTDTKMIPNTANCPGYWGYEVACGCKKGAWS